MGYNFDQFFEKVSQNLVERSDKTQGSASNSKQQTFLYPNLIDQLNPKNPLLKMAKVIPWDYLEESFREFYSATGRPAKPIRLMVGLCILKHLDNLSDDALVERWVQNPYDQAFCGVNEFQWSLPCDPSDLVYFRKRIGKEGFEKLLAVSVGIHGEKIHGRLF